MYNEQEILIIKLFNLTFKPIEMSSGNIFRRISMLEQIKKVLVDAINVDEALVTENASLKDDLDIDSLSAVELALELETEFDVTIEDEELAKLETVQDIMDLIASKQ